MRQTMRQHVERPAFTSPEPEVPHPSFFKTYTDGEYPNASLFVVCPVCGVYTMADGNTVGNAYRAAKDHIREFH